VCVGVCVGGGGGRVESPRLTETSTQPVQCLRMGGGDSAGGSTHAVFKLRKIAQGLGGGWVGEGHRGGPTGHTRALHQTRHPLPHTHGYLEYPEVPEKSMESSENSREQQWYTTRANTVSTTTWGRYTRELPPTGNPSSTTELTGVPGLENASLKNTTAW
jgi:hypothetical protein